jgi:hypothetical protein
MLEAEYALCKKSAQESLPDPASKPKEIICGVMLPSTRIDQVDREIAWVTYVGT